MHGCTNTVIAGSERAVSTSAVRAWIVVTATLVSRDAYMDIGGTITRK